MTKKNTARLAGLVYLLLVLTGIFNLLYVPSQLIVWNNPALTVSNITESEFLFRLSIVAGIFSYIFYLILPLILYKLFESVNKNVAIAMVALSVISVPISLFNMVNKVDVLTLLSNAQFLTVFTAEEIAAQVMLLLRSYNNGIAVVQVFWGLWLFPFGYLAFKSGYVPRLFGVLLMAGCFGYMIKFLGRLLYPEFDIPSFVGKPGSLGEIGICLWLLIMGAKTQSDAEKHAENG
ncbi:DUF4386 domain-containing protein [Colwelliaceae bacterium 6471]